MALGIIEALLYQLIKNSLVLLKIFTICYFYKQTEKVVVLYCCIDFFLKIGFVTVVGETECKKFA